MGLLIVSPCKLLRHVVLELILVMLGYEALVPANQDLQFLISLAFFDSGAPESRITVPTCDHLQYECSNNLLHVSCSWSQGLTHEHTFCRTCTCFVLVFFLSFFWSIRAGGAGGSRRAPAPARERRRVTAGQIQVWCIQVAQTQPPRARSGV